jgi:hypothetical protein
MHANCFLLPLLCHSLTVTLTLSHSHSTLQAMLDIVKNPTRASLMGGAGRARVVKCFSFAAFANTLNAGVLRLAPARK